MALAINLSQLGGNRADFEMAVANHIAAMISFRSTKDKPRPVAHPLVESAIKIIKKDGKPDDYAADYYIVDDTPPAPVETFDDKIRKHYAALVAAENAAKYKILPERKVRFVSLEYNTAMSKPEAERTDADYLIITAYKEVERKWTMISLLGAKAEAALADLTEDTIDTWLPPTFE